MLSCTVPVPSGVNAPSGIAEVFSCCPVLLSEPEEFPPPEGVAAFEPEGFSSLGGFVCVPDGLWGAVVAVFRENDAGRIYGVTFIDRTTHQVFNGSRLGKEYAADAFEAWFNGREQESSTPIQEELRPLAPLEPPQPGLSSVEEFEEYIETHYVSMPDVMGELMEYTPEKEWETAPEYRLFPRRKKRRRKIRKRI